MSSISQETIGRIAGDLEAATSARKCHACGCFQDAVVALEQSEIGSSLNPLVAQARSRFTERGYDCLGCEVCWPAEALNSAAEVVNLPAGAGCRAESPKPSAGWPVFPGDYRVIRFMAPVAVCTLHSKGLVDEVERIADEGLSIVGSLQTENLGIERLIENVVSNPNLRFLVLCGEDPSGTVGHFPGQSLLALATDGLDERGRIRGARGKRPVIENLDRAAVSHFRESVEVIDAIGVSDVSRIAGHVKDCAARDPGPVPSTPSVERRVPVLRAEGPETLSLDPAGYLVVTPDRRRDMIVVEHYGNDGILRTIVEGRIAVDLAATLVREGLVTRLDHAAYIGRELTRAEIAVRDRNRAPDDVRPGQDNTDSGGSR